MVTVRSQGLLDHRWHLYWQCVGRHTALTGGLRGRVGDYCDLEAIWEAIARTFTSSTRDQSPGM